MRPGKGLVFILSFLFLTIITEAGTLPRKVKVADLFTPSEIKLLKSGEILTYASMKGKGEAFAGGVSDLLPRKAGSLYDYPSTYSVVSVEKVFFRGGYGDSRKISERITDYPALKGMKYHSLSEGRAKTLIIESSLSGEKKVLQEGNGTLWVDRFTIMDNRLGTISFRGETWSSRGVVMSWNINTEHVSRFAMKIFEPGDYRVYKYFVYDRQAGGWFFCSIQLMRVRSDIMKSINLLKPENMCNRIRGETVHILRLLGHNRMEDMAAFR
ncbi:MAG TPA: hypothetical protein PK358_11695 [Spirochaetota bacterium]|nr:hypothetical protein [Spirochaetota bacterium]HPJ35493.1 hypothetical protein [Spirochaetota bacterium]